jgi:hypothetical protein
VSNVEDITKRGPVAARPVRGPKCPCCGSQPAQLTATQSQFGNMVAAVFSCFACDAILGIAPVAMMQPEKPRILVPGGGF